MRSRIKYYGWLARTIVILSALACLAATSLWNKGQAAIPLTPVVVNFENLVTTGRGQGGQTAVSDQYADKGVIFNSPVVLDYSKGIPVPGFARSGTKAIEQCYSREFCTTPIEMRFTSGQRRLKVWVGYSDRLNEARIVVLRAFNISGSLIAEASTPLAPSDGARPIRAPLEVVSEGSGIVRAEVRFSQETTLMNNLAVDDVEFESFSPLPVVLDLVRVSNIIFRGTVQSVNASTLPLVPAGNATVTVRVDEVLTAPQVVSDFIGREITVKLSTPGSAAIGLQSVFFTQGWIAGKGIGVIEVGRIDNVQDTASLRAQIAAARLAIADEDLGIYLSTAEIVVVGRVSEVRDAANQVQPGSEHDPLPREAVVQIESIVKGQPGGSSVVFQFASSNDVAWFDAPKFAPDQSGIFILRRSQIRQSQGPVLAALDPRDFQTRDKLERIRRLIGG